MNMDTNTKLKEENISTYSDKMNVGRLLLALYDVYGDTAPEVGQHANFHAPSFEDNVIYSDRYDRNTLCIVKIKGQLIAAQHREDLQYVHLPNGEDNPLLDTDY